MKIGRARLMAIAGAALAMTLSTMGIGSSGLAAGPRPLFQLPFACGEQWVATTYSTHSPNTNSLDLTRVGGGSNNQPILASYAGRVVNAGWDNGGGWFVRIDHGNGWQTRYLHMITTPAVGIGAQVSRGQRLGNVGSTGDSGAPHLHYEQMQDGTTVRSAFNGTLVTVNVGVSQRLTSYNCGEKHAIAVGDLNNDGLNDLVGRKANSDIWFTPNVGGGNGVTWGTGWLVAGGSGFDAIDVGDLNNDGLNDLVGLRPNGDVWFTPNLGGGNGITWGTGWPIVGGSGFDSISVGDLNNDGLNDLVGRRSANGDIWFSPNIGGGNGVTWGAGWVVASGSGLDSIDVGDLNNDGLNDLVGRRSANGDIWFSPNIGGGNGVTWGAGWVIASGSGLDTISVGDMNNNGLNDLVGRRSANGDIWFSPNIGGGNGITWGPGWVIASGSGY